MLVVTHQLWNMVQSAHSWITVPWSIQQSNERPSTQDGVKRNELDFKVPERCLASEFSLLLCSYHHLVYSIQTPLLHNPSLILTSGGGTFCICFSSLPSRYPPPQPRDAGEELGVSGLWTRRAETPGKAGSSFPTREKGLSWLCI